jgi:hypothetical protein
MLLQKNLQQTSLFADDSLGWIIALIRRRIASPRNTFACGQLRKIITRRAAFLWKAAQ